MGKKSIILKSIGIVSLYASASFAVLKMAPIEKIESKKINLEAFVNLAENIKYLNQQNTSENLASDINREVLIVNSINKELDREIKKQKNNLSYKLNKVDTVSFKLSSIKRENKSIDLSVYEINNSDDIVVKKFQAEKISKVEMSIPTIQEEVAVAEKIDSTDEMVFFEYKDKPEVKNELKAENINTKLYERPISDTVKNVIKREIGEIPVVENKKKKIETKVEIIPEEKNNESMESEEALNDQVVFDYSSTIRKAENNISESKVSALVAKNVKNVEVNIRAIDVNLNNGSVNHKSSFEFEPDYDRNERIYDNNSGEIRYSLTTEAETSIATGVLVAQEYVPTRLDLVMNTHNTVVPMFKEEMMNSFLTKHSTDKVNAILISMPSALKDVDIDSEYSKKIFLNSKFKEDNTNRQFVMFLGVTAGNILVKYDIEGSTSQKIIYVGEGEIYFEEPVFEKGERNSFELTTRKLLSTKNTELNISNRDVRVFNTDIVSKKQGLNVYELKMPTSVAGNRKYIQVKTDGNDVFVGVDGPSKIEIPEKEFISRVIQKNNINSLEDRCLIQVNLNKEISNIVVAGKNASGDMYLETSYLTGDGEIQSEYSEDAEKVFIIGEQIGIVSANIEYSNGTKENMKTYCSNGTYLIEQLR
jgi:hypothetical protein